jgi:hypothetical protein
MDNKPRLLIVDDIADNRAVPADWDARDFLSSRPNPANVRWI